MNYFILDNINFKLKPENITLKFCNDADINYINLSTKKFIEIIKGKINNCSEEWDNLKKLTNEYEYIHTNIPQYKNCVSKIKPISRAFFKLIEIFNTFNILDNFKNKNIKTFHLAEGPGGFIEAITYLRFNKSDIYYGMTLIDEQNKSIPGWKKADDFLKKNQNVFIEYGADKTGN